MESEFEPVSSSHVILPIENHKCPKNAKNACADALISPQPFHSMLSETLSSLLKRFCTGNPTKIYVFWRCNTFPELKVSRDLKQEQCLCVIDCDIFRWASLLHFRDSDHKPISAPAHALLAFLGYLWFSMGNIKVVRWSGLEILIPKHMWKSKIGLL